MAAKLTARQTAELTLIADNPGRVVATLRNQGAAYLKINGNTEAKFLKAGLVRESAPVERRTMNVAGELLEYDVTVWEITAEGLALLGR